MVTGTFTTEMQRAGAELTQRLDRQGLGVKSAMWIFDPETNTWQLLYGISEVDTLGPRRVYKKVLSAINADQKPLEPIDFSDVSVKSPKYKLFQMFPSAFHNTRFSHGTVNGHYVEDAFIYRIS